MIAIVIAFISLAGAVLTGLELKNGYASKAWPMVEGTVSKFEILQTIGDRMDYISMEYAYTVEGRQYLGDRVSFKMFYEDESMVDLRKKVGFIGAKVSVHYNPERESEAVLYPGVNWVLVCFFIIMFGVCVAFVPFSVLFVLELWGVDWDRHFRRRKW